MLSKATCVIRRGLTLISIVAMAGVLGWAALSSGEAPLDNDPEDARETYQSREDLAPGQIEVLNEDGDGFEGLEFGVQGGGALFGWRDLDGDEREAELVASDPTLSADAVRLADADGDGDAEVIWVGTRGADFDGSGEVIVEESGRILGLIDIDGDGNTEIIAQDTSRVLGEFHRDGFGINRSEDDSFEILWVGILGENGRGRAATFLGFGDVNDDGESEVELQDIRTSGFGPFDQFIDVDDDGDADIVVRVPKS